MGKQLQLQQLLLLPVQTPKSNTTLNTRLLRMRIRFTSLRMKHVMGTSSKAPIPLWIPAVPWSLSTEAGQMGYSETREEKLGFVEIRSKPARVAPAPPKVDQGTLIQRILAILQPQIGSAVSSALQARREGAAAEAARLEAERRAAAEAARIEAERRAAAEAAAAAAAASSSNSIDIFGNGGYNVRVQTPDFKIEY